MHSKSRVAPNTSQSVLATHTVLRNTYLLLSMTTLFSALVCAASVALNLPAPGFILTIAGMFGFSYLTQHLSKSPWGIAACFAFTGFMGYILGPLINVFLSQYVNGYALPYY